MWQLISVFEYGFYGVNKLWLIYHAVKNFFFWEYRNRPLREFRIFNLENLLFSTRSFFLIEYIDNSQDNSLEKLVRSCYMEFYDIIK